MKELIQQLKVLNEIDLKIGTIRKDLERLPKELAEKQIVSKNLRIILDKLKGEMMRVKADADSLELEVKAGEDALKRFSNQLNNMRTKKEYDTLRNQMDAQRGWNKGNENKVLELLEQVDAKQKEIDKNNALLAESDKVLTAETERVNKEVGELKAQLETLSGQRNQMAGTLPEKEVTIYNRIVATRGQAITKVERGICGACFMKIPPQTHNMVLLGAEIVTCPSCGRILTTA